ncbi:MAG: type VI immunity family protein [Hyalangium sp.]|uniref:type VI immunity family protein n=1 Tax=Hyalangium sp. TaxID=2028555 RepID=UPI00389AE688
MSEHYPRVRFHADHGGLMVRDGLKIWFCLGRPALAMKGTVLRALDIYLRAIGPQTLQWHLDLEGYWQPLDPQSWEASRSDLSEAPGSSVLLIDDPSVGAAAFHFEYHVKRLDDPFTSKERILAAAVGFWLPTEFLEEHGPGAVRELALELASLLPFQSGQAGLFFNAMLGYRETEEELSRLCLRYPGMDIGAVEFFARLEGQVKGPSWLTFLGQPVLGELGGVEGLRSRLSSPGTTVQQLDGERAVITLGPWPEAGDTEAGRNLPEYRELARVLEPWLYHASGPWSSYFPEETWRRWERRFLD